MAQYLSTFSKQFWNMLFIFVCQTPVFPTDLKTLIYSLPVGGAVGPVSPVMAVMKSARWRSQMLLYQALQKDNENDIKDFLETVGSFQR